MTQTVESHRDPARPCLPAICYPTSVAGCTQLHLKEIKEDELAKLIKPISVGGASASYVELTGPPEPAPRQGLLAILATHGDQVWFIKLMGDAALAERERANFEAFAKSIKFTAQ